VQLILAAVDGKRELAFRHGGRPLMALHRLGWIFPISNDGSTVPNAPKALFRQCR